MNQNCEVLKNIVECIRQNIPFAAFALPSQGRMRLFANPSYPKGSGERFIISPWLGNFEDAICIYNEISSPLECMRKDLHKSFFKPESISTSREDYLKKVNSLIEHLKIRGGKTVISRIITGDTDNLDLEKFIDLRFSRYKDTFKFAFYTPETGVWIGTSPEELLTFDAERERFSITSLAGTRHNSDIREWDAKNIFEQSMVSRYIGDTLNNLGIKYITKICNDVYFYPVRHLCHRFFGQVKADRIPELINKLSPTPALCGYPKETAIKEISETENFKRNCYGGYVGYENNKNLSLYVNLRCINISSDKYCIYAGGGITGASEAEREWDETASKAETMMEDLNNSMIHNDVID